MIGTETKDYTPEDGEIMVPKGSVHSLRGFHDEETIFEEKTGPVVFYPFLSLTWSRG